MAEAATATAKLPQLQNLIKRDPEGYAEDFERQHRHFLSELQIFRLDPSKQKSESFGALVTFLSHVAACYPVQCRQFPAQLTELIRKHGRVLHPGIRLTVLQALLLLRNRGLLQALDLFPLLFEVMEVQDKAMRQLAYSHMVSDLRKMHGSGSGGGGGGNSKVMGSTAVRVRDGERRAAVGHGAGGGGQEGPGTAGGPVPAAHLDRRRTVNTIAQACISASTRIGVSAMRFFLGIEAKMADDDEVDMKEVLDTHSVDDTATPRRRRDARAPR